MAYVTHEELKEFSANLVKNISDELAKQKLSNNEIIKAIEEIGAELDDIKKLIMSVDEEDDAEEAPIPINELPPENINAPPKEDEAEEKEEEESSEQSA